MGKKKTQTRRRYHQSRRNPGEYYDQILAHRADPDNVDEPESEEVEVVETFAIQGGEKVKIRVYADRVDAYEKVVAEWEASQEDDS